MTTTRTTFSLDLELAEQARKLDVNVSAAAREGVAAAVRAAMAQADRDAYQAAPESADTFWTDSEAWGTE
jgi:post-segregation antitoxin (ccd killing protein)